MPIDIIDTVGNQIQVLDDGTTIADIMNALGWVQKEKARQRGKYQRYYKSKKEAKPVKEALPKRPRGRPRKSPPVEITSSEN
jgi:hypothetical protein